MPINGESQNKKPVEAIEVGSKPISKLLEQMANTGFQGKGLAQVTDIYQKMIKDPECFILMGYAGSMSTTGMWKIINYFLEHKYVDILVPTGANISEDIVDAIGYPYKQSETNIDDQELFQKGLNRYYDVVGREKDYAKMTSLISEFILTLEPNIAYSSREFLKGFGDYLVGKGVECIVSVAAKANIPIFCPAIADSPYGDAALICESKGFHLCIDNMKDYREFMSISQNVKETGVFYIGGGVPKDFIQLFAVTPALLHGGKAVPGRAGLKRSATGETATPHKYAVQVTLALEQDGGLSGCTFSEASSWGKEDPEGFFKQCFCDATIALPIISHALYERLGNYRRKGREVIADTSSTVQRQATSLDKPRSPFSQPVKQEKVTLTNILGRNIYNGRQS